MNRKYKRACLIICLFLTADGCTAQQKCASAPQSPQLITDGGGLLSSMPVLRDFRSKRASSWDRTGQNSDWLTIAPGKSADLLTEKGAGCIKHFYWAYIEKEEPRRLNLFRGVVLRMFWDGSDKPSVEVPLGDFFGVTNGQIRPIRSLAFVTNPGLYTEAQLSWGFNCYLPMPFAAGARIELENQGAEEAKIWFHIEYELYDKSASISPDVGRFHALWNRENPTKAVKHDVNDWNKAVNLSDKENYTILDIKGDGQLAGYFLTVVNHHREWWGEGDDMIFIDGEPFPPSYHGTGSEEIFGGGACPVTEYTGLYTGFHCIENRSSYRWYGNNGAYRFYLTDPIRFKKTIRITLEHGHANDKANDYSTTAFWYQKGINKDLPSLPPIAKREINFK